MIRNKFCRLASLLCFLVTGLSLCGTVLAAPHKEILQISKTLKVELPNTIQSKEDIATWMTYYYLKPRPELLVPAIHFADKHELFAGNAQAPFLAFIAEIMAQNPTRIKEWMSQLDTLKPEHHRMLFTAIWWSRSKEGKEYLESLAQKLPEKEKKEFLKEISTAPPSFEKMDIDAPDVLDMLWASFSATGDNKFVLRIMSTLPWVKTAQDDYTKMAIGSAAKWSLTSNAQQHPQVMELCLLERDKPDLNNDLKPYLTEIINEAQSHLATNRKTK